MLKRRWFLYLTEFFSGMSVMAIELGASRLLAPYFSSSQIIWTIIIGAIMIAMALGNIWGGRLADKNPSPDKMYFRILIVAVWTAAIPFVGKYVIAGVSLMLALLGGSNFLIWASLLSCILLFVFPLMLLGSVSPALVKYAVKSLDENGKIVGELNALNTVGSIIGTFTPTFITIPAVGTAWTFIIFAAILLAIALTYFVTERRRLVSVSVMTALAIAFSALASLSTFSFNPNSYEDESVYNYLRVEEDDRQIILSTNVLIGVQSITKKDSPLAGNYNYNYGSISPVYYDFGLAAPYMAGAENKDQMDVLVLGMGTGTFATECYNYFDNSVIEGVEIDEKIINLAYDRFGLPKDDRIKCVEFDARAYLRGAGKYDVIMVDAYRDITVQFQLSSAEFFSEVKSHLTKNGVMLLNLNMTSASENSINDYLCDTVDLVFDSVYTAQAGGNIVVFASDNPNFVEDFRASYELDLEKDDRFLSLMYYVDAVLTKYEGGDRILTDDKAPVELLGMKVVDELITEQLELNFSNISIDQLLDMIK